MTVFVPLSTQPVFWNGKPTPGCKLTVYDAGTLTPRTAYADGLLAADYEQPILTDGNGCIPEIWVQGNPYRVRILSPTGVLIREIDNLPGDTATSTSPPPPPLAKPFQTGDIVYMYGTAIVTGRVRMNGKTIGSASSSATELASADCHDLYVWLWNGDINLVVIGGRGLSAALDWGAAKPITLPDARGRALWCLDTMGSSAAGRLAGCPFTAGDATTLGSVGGEGMHMLTVSEITAHTHAGTTASGGSHAHTGTTNASTLIDRYGSVLTDSAGAHTHGSATGAFSPVAVGSGSTDSVPNHSHGGLTSTENRDHTHQYFSGASTANVNAGTTFAVPINVGTYNTSGVSLSHQHSITPDGGHTHAVSVSVTVASHTHTINADGVHQHNYHDTTQPHTHTFLSDAGGVHTHTFTSDSTGGGLAHNNLPPAILITAYLVL